MAHKLEELPVFSHAEEFTVAVTATLRRSRVRKDCDTYKQIVEANDSILANMHEGFEQGTDDGFAKYLYHSKGSLPKSFVVFAARRRGMRSTRVRSTRWRLEPNPFAECLAA